MPRVVESTEIDHWVELYENGMSYEQIANERGFGTMTVWRNLRSRGSGRTRADAQRRAFENAHSAIAEAVCDAYRSGESELSLSQRFGIQRGAIATILARGGVERRGPSEVNRLRFLDPAERGRVGVKAHLAMGEGEHQLAELLAKRGFVFDRQQIAGPYNLDLSFRDLAVEVHRSATNPFAPSGRELSRCEALLGAGWNVIYVWTSGLPIEAGAADYIVAFLEETRRDPAAPRQYRVIRRNGDLAAGGRNKPNHLSFVASPRRRKRSS